ncbi:ankyrin repeat domain-containing protein 50-like [Argopecten irradians]|uniref:ankyrin repeat domain-containing protein 50-like n=1 Tax=Argopecten irradians TaxID=31199 RepID=UPI00371EE4EF
MHRYQLFGIFNNRTTAKSSNCISHSLRCQYWAGDALSKAAGKGHREIVELLLSHGVDPNSGNALLVATICCHREIVELLLSYGADPNSALASAAEGGHIDIVKILLSHGADPKKGDALSEAAGKGHREIVELLLSHGADPNSGYALSEAARNALSEAARNGHREIVELLLSHGVDPNSGDALSEAAGEGHREIVELLLSHGADPNSYDALNYAAGGGFTDIVKLLLSHRADPNKGYPLKAAVNSHNIEILRLLLDNGADVQLSKALRFAADERQGDMVSLLLVRGADPKQLDSDYDDDDDYYYYDDDDDAVKELIANKQEQIKQQQATYAEGIKEAVENPCNITITVVGHHGVGKSCLVNQLIQESIPEGGPGSTDTAEFYVNYMAFNQDTGVRRKLNGNGEIVTVQHRLRSIIDRYRKSGIREEKRPEKEPGSSHRDTKNTSIKAAKGLPLLSKRHYLFVLARAKILVVTCRICYIRRLTLLRLVLNLFSDTNRKLSILNFFVILWCQNAEIYCDLNFNELS